MSRYQRQCFPVNNQMGNNQMGNNQMGNNQMGNNQMGSALNALSGEGLAV